MLRVVRPLRHDGAVAEPRTVRSRRAVALPPGANGLFGRLIAIE